MRDLKFRAWDGKQFYYSDDEAYLLKEYDGILWLVEDVNFYKSNNETKEYFKIGKARQCTGLKDNSTPPKEIYEGDIVKEYLADQTIIVIQNYDLLNHLENFVGQENLEVIGNVYENPELLEKGVV